MWELYSIKRTEEYLAHANKPAQGGVYNNHKYLARVLIASGRYRYFYSPQELMAYKRAKNNLNGQNQLTRTSTTGMKQLKKTSDSAPASSSTSSGGNKTLREKWEERRKLLGETGSKKGSGGSGKGSGGGSGKGSGGGSSRGSSSSKSTSVPKKSGLSTGALTYKGVGKSTVISPLNKAVRDKEKADLSLTFQRIKKRKKRR